MDFNVNVNVRFDATPALAGVVTTLAGVCKPVGVMQPTTTAPAISPPMVEAEKPTGQESKQAASTASVSETVSTEQIGQELTNDITDEALRKIVGPVSKAKGKEAVFAILDEFGVKRVPDLKQEQRQTFIDKVNAL